MTLKANTFLFSLLTVFSFVISANATPETDLKRAKVEEETNSRAAALNMTIQSLVNYPTNKDIYLYALELAEEASESQLETLEIAANNNLKRQPSEYIWNLGLCKIKRISKNPEDSLFSCLRALQYSKNNFISTLELALTYKDLKVYDRAQEFLQKAIDIKPSDYTANFKMAQLYETLERYDEAKSYYLKALALSGENTNAQTEINSAAASSAIKKINVKIKEIAKKRNFGKTTKKSFSKNLKDTKCYQSFIQELDREDFTKAAQIGRRCRRILNNNVEFSEKFADALVNAGEYEEAIDEYEHAITITSSYDDKFAILNFKEAQTLIKLDNFKEAEKKYKVAATYADNNVDILKTVANYFLLKSRKKDALFYYDMILKVNPYDYEIEEKADNIRLETMSNAEILDALKIRKAISENAIILQPDDVTLFRNLRYAETHGAVDTVQKLFPTRKKLLVEAGSKDNIKVLLTLAGYKTYISATTKDVIKFFESKKINFREIFKLRDIEGNALFETNGQVTLDGIKAWHSGQKGKTEWIYSYQPIPGSALQIESSKQIKELSARGYREISEPEYLWLLRATNCPEDVLEKTPISLTKVFDGAVTRYMLCYIDDSTCSNQINQNLPPYIERYREGDTSVSTGKSSAFFGTGAVKQFRFCENGRIWTGDTTGAEVNLR